MFSHFHSFLQLLFSLLIFILTLFIKNSLLSPDGSLLAFAGSADNQVGIYAAIASNLWSLYRDQARASLNDQDVQVILLNCEEGKVVIQMVSNLLLCVVGDETTQFGMLRAKVQALATHIEVPLKKLEGYL